MYKRYEKYKDSGVEWIGEIPEGWKIKPLKHLCAIIMGQSPSSEDCNIIQEGLPFLQGNAEFGEIHPAPKQYCMQPNKKAEKEDILLSVRAPVGALNIADQKYGIGRGLCAIRAISIINEYAWYLMHCVLNELYLNMTGSTYDAVSVNDVKNVNAIYPNRNEQSLIANFLDHKTTEIDSLITDKEELINRLEEYKQSIITEAVTKGLNPDVKMKDSGIEWIGEIPDHWEFIPLRWLVNIKNGDSISREEYNEKGIIPIYGGNGIISFTDKPNVNYQTIVVGRVGALCGNVHYVEHDKAWVSDNAMYLSIWDHKKVSLKYLELIMKALKLNDYASKTAQPLITGETVKRQSIPLPPIDEQYKLINYIAKINKENETLTVDNSNQIQNLKTYRQSLIFEAVTGKIDVRDYQSERSEQFA